VELLRVLQEALVNARRHSDARCVDVVLCGGHGEVRAEVADDGLGFDPASVRRGVGISGMRERATALGGEFAAGPTPDGWRMSCRLPLEASDALPAAGPRSR
jgi:signal transduction histidine kinase